MHEDHIVDAIAKEVGARRAPAGTPTAQPRSQRPRCGSGSASVAPRTRAATAVAVAVVIATSGSSAPAPLHFAMAVSGTQLAPGADGSASLTKTGSGWDRALGERPSASGERALLPGLAEERGRGPRFGGHLHDAKHVTLWSGVSVTQCRTLTVTVQPADGNPISSRKPVLIGRITPSGRRPALGRGRFAVAPRSAVRECTTRTNPTKEG